MKSLQSGRLPAAQSDMLLLQLLGEQRLSMELIAFGALLWFTCCAFWCRALILSSSQGAEGA